MITYLQSKYLPEDPKDIPVFKHELDFYDTLDSHPLGQATLVFFEDKTCGDACVHLLPDFRRAATYYKRIVTFMHVNCDSNEAGRIFCSNVGAHSYPMFVLFTGEKQIKLTLPGDPTVLSYGNLMLPYVQDPDALPFVGSLEDDLEGQMEW